MCGCARDKTCDRSGIAAAKRAAQTLAPQQQPPERREAFHVATDLATHRFLALIAGCRAPDRPSPQWP